MKRLYAILILAMLTFSLVFVNATPATSETTRSNPTMTQKHGLGALYVSPEEYERVTGFKFKRLTPENYLELIERAPEYPGRSTETLKETLKNLAYSSSEASPNLPLKIVNTRYLPPIRSQGPVGSCVGWASTYYTWTYMVNWWNWNSFPSNDDEIMNPTFTYNLINNGTDSGSYPLDAINLISTIGAVPLSSFPLFVKGPYGDPDNYAWLWSNDTQWIEAAYNRAWYPTSFDVYVLDLTNQDNFTYFKYLLARGYVAFTVIEVYDDFHNDQLPDNVYALNQDHEDYKGGHAVTIVGYDDTKQTPDGQGAFLLVNSWGTDWGDSGYFWLTYQAAQDTNHKLSRGYAYLIVPRDYQPKAFVGFKINHPKRGQIIGQGGIEIGIGDPNSPIWSREYFNFYMGHYTDLSSYQAHPFPNTTIYLDITDAIENASKVVNSPTVPVYIKVKDKYQDGVTGTLDKVEVLTPLGYTVKGVYTQIPEGKDLVALIEVPLAEYMSPTPSDGDTLAQSWLYVEVDSIVDVNNAEFVLTKRGYDKGTKWYQVGQPQAIEGTDWVITVIDIDADNNRAIVIVKNAVTGQESDQLTLEKYNPVDIFGDGSVILTLEDTFVDANGHPVASIHAVIDSWSATYWMWTGSDYQYNMDYATINVTGLEPDNYTYQVILNLTNGNEITMPERVVTLLGDPVATLRILSRPSGASVYIDGNYTGTTPLTIEVPAGDYNIAIEKHGYETYRTSVNLGNQEERTIDAVLTPVGDYALYPIGDYPSSVGNASSLFFVFNNLGTPDAFSTALYVSPTAAPGNDVRRISRLASTFDFGEVSPGDTVVSVGGPLVNPVTARYDNVSPVHMVIENGVITIVTPQGNVTWKAPKPWWNATEGYFVIQGFADKSINATVFTIYGTDADSTAAGAYYFMNIIYPNITNYRDVHYIVGQWRDTEAGADIPLPGASQGDTSGFSAEDAIEITFIG
ncbi:hypothetical protein A3L11_03450 [Thermococcus siculi]|uniref:Peptidase C1A papain C-terminal domain-containing protein n=1 Tax=Thermococcus siculi TaxID=72803 RepID=A0A2Z2ML12_9EURY|nr:hypothetical protein A3L11_03450 [Thermococcus siculi]